MNEKPNRRDFLELLGVGGVVFASGLAGCTSRSGVAQVAAAASGAPATLAPPADDFFFLQLTDTHWGFRGAPNPEADVSLKKAIATINADAKTPDFIVFTGDLTHTTDDPKERRARMAQFREIVAELKVKNVRFLPGEHDASPDRGEAYREVFGETHYAFDHKGVHFVAIDNASESGGAIGQAQLDWLASDLARLPKAAPIVVFAHRPLFDLYPQWEWATKDGDRAIEILSQHDNVTVFYGHIHQEHHQTTGRIQHHSARSLVFPLPAPGSAPKRAPLQWDASAADHGLGYREIDLVELGRAPNLIEITSPRIHDR